MEVQFRIPNAMVYRSYVLEGMWDISCAFASTKDTCGAWNEVQAMIDWSLNGKAHYCDTSSS